MLSRRHWHLATLAAAAALIVAGCGGGDNDKLDVGKVVVFGDSLSDNGAYTPATTILRVLNPSDARPNGPYFGGKFTTNTFTEYQMPPAGVSRPAGNTNNANVWNELVAARLGVAITPHEAGFGPQTLICPAATTIGPNSCTGHAQGGSRVSNLGSNPNGTGLIGSTPVPMSRPMTTQVANHLARFTSFAGNDIVFVWIGSNDAIAQFQTNGATPTVAIANMQSTATELANLVKTQILAKGAARVAVLNLVDVSSAPGFASFTTQQKALLTQLTAEFNTKLAADLAGTAARMVDMRALLADAVATPGKYGLTNVTGVACGTPAFNPSGNSLTCNASPAALFAAGGAPNLNGLAAGASASTWLFADGIHPTTGGHKVVADYVFDQIKSFGWVPNNL